MDHELTADHRLFGRFSRHSNHELRPSTFPALGATELSGPACNLAVSLTSNFGTSIVHEFRFSRMYGEYRSTVYFQGQGSDLLASAGVKGLEQAQDPAIPSLPGVHVLGLRRDSRATPATAGRNGRIAASTSSPTTLTWVKGPHIMKFGGRIFRRNILFTDARDHNGVYGFTGVMTQIPALAAGTGDGFADFLLGYPANSTRSNPATWWGGYGTYWHVFFQDDFKVLERPDPEPGDALRVHALADRLPRAGGGVRPHARRVRSSSRARPARSISARSGSRMSDMPCSRDLIQTSSEAGRAAEHHQE